MNYSTLFKNFRREISSMVQYDHLGAPYKAFAFVATLPFWMFFGILLCFKYVYLFVFNAFVSSSEYLEAWVKETKKGVNHATEAVIYFVTTPFIFFLRCICSLFSGVFYLLWFVTMCFGYIASLGGARWQPFIADAEYDSNKKCVATTNKTAGYTVSLIGFILFCLYILLYLIGVSSGSSVMQVANIIGYIYGLFMVIAIPVTFKKVFVDSDSEEAGAVSIAKPSLAKNPKPEEEFPEF